MHTYIDMLATFVNTIKTGTDIDKTHVQSFLSKCVDNCAQEDTLQSRSKSSISVSLSCDTNDAM